MANDNDSDKKDAGKKKYKCTRPIMHNHKMYKETISLTDEEAAPLLEIGAIAK